MMNPPLPLLELLKEKRSVFYLGLLFALHLIFYTSTGLYQCRYSLFEDQEIIQTTAKINRVGATAAFMEQIRYETRGRFRPVYVLYRVTACAILGDHIRWHHLFFYVLFILNTFLLFWWGRSMGFSPFLSFLFTLLVYTGTQSNVGWRLANGENFGLLFLNLAILCFIDGLYRRRRGLIIIAWMLMWLAAFSKESFIFCFGFFPLLYIGLSLTLGFERKKMLGVCLGAMGCIGIYVLCIRLFMVVPDAMKYAGSSISLSDILRIQFGAGEGISYPERIWQTFIFQASFFQSYILLLALTATIALIVSKHRKVILYSMAIALAFLVVHKLLYLRILLFNIYMYPVIVAVGYVIIFFLNLVLVAGKKICGIALIIAVLGVLIHQSVIAYNYSRSFCEENKAAVRLTDDLAKHVHSDTMYVQADPILHPEFIYSIKARLGMLGKQSPMKYVSVEDGDTLEALHIMKMTDPSLIPFLREQFYVQFHRDTTFLLPQNGLDGKHTWVIIQRPGRRAPQFEEVKKHTYIEDTYSAPGFYEIIVLRPVGQ